MVEIIKESREFSDVEKYLMTISPNMTQMNSVPDDTKITIAGYLVFNDIKDDGTSTEVMSIITPEKKVYSAQSKTFKKAVYDICALFNNAPVGIIKTSGETKAGRKYINCFLDVESV